MQDIKNGEQIMQEKAAIEAAGVASAPAGPLLPLEDGVDLENQLKRARQAVCVPGVPNATCALLVRMSLLVSEDVGAEPQIRERYAELVASQVASPANE